MLQHLSARTVLLCALAMTVTGRTADGQTDTLGSTLTRFGLMSLARGQTASLNVVLPDTARLSGPCALVLQFVDARNQPFVTRTGVPVRREVALLPGEAAVVELGVETAFAGTSALRRFFRATVDAVQDMPPDSRRSCAALIAAVEVYDNLTGRAQVHVLDPGPAKARVPNPGPPEAGR